MVLEKSNHYYGIFGGKEKKPVCFIKQRILVNKIIKIRDGKGGSGFFLFYFHDVSEIQTTRLTKFALTMPFITIFVDFEQKKISAFCGGTIV